MRTSLNEIKEIEDHLTGRHNAEEQILFEAKSLLDPLLPQKISWQNNTYCIIRLYGREQIKREIEAIHDELFKESRNKNFVKKVLGYFH